MAQQAERTLQKELKLRIPINIESRYLSASEAMATGCGIFLTANTTTDCVFGGTGFGRKGKPAEEVANDAANELIKAVKELGCVDEHLQDQVCELQCLSIFSLLISCFYGSIHF